MDRIEQIRAAHLSARPKPAVNPAWANAERDIGVLLAEVDGLRTVLHRAQEALGEYACHIGSKHPCIRTPDQCRNECGKVAGDAALLIDAALEPKP